MEGERDALDASPTKLTASDQHFKSALDPCTEQLLGGNNDVKVWRALSGRTCMGCDAGRS